MAESEEIVRQARRRNGTHNAKRRFVESRSPVDWPTRYRGRTAGRHEKRRCRSGRRGAGRPVARRIRRESDVAEALDRMWPRLSPHELIHDLFGAKPLLAAAGKGSSSPMNKPCSIGPAVRPSTTWRGRWRTVPWSMRLAPCLAHAIRNARAKSETATRKRPIGNGKRADSGRPV